MSDSFKSESGFTIPWSVKGVSIAARNKAKEAAAASGKTIGAWLSDAIRAANNDAALFLRLTEQSMGDGQKTETPSAANSSNTDESALLNYLQKMDQKLSALTDRMQAMEQNDNPPAPDFDVAAAGHGKNFPTQ